MQQNQKQRATLRKRWMSQLKKVRMVLYLWLLKCVNIYQQIYLKYFSATTSRRANKAAEQEQEQHEPATRTGRGAAMKNLNQTAPPQVAKSAAKGKAAKEDGATKKATATATKENEKPKTTKRKNEIDDKENEGEEQEGSPPKRTKRDVATTSNQTLAEITNKSKKPTFEIMVKEAIYHLGERNDSSLQKIKKFMEAHYAVDMNDKRSVDYVKKYIHEARTRGSINTLKDEKIHFGRTKFKLGKDATKAQEMAAKKREQTKKKVAAKKAATAMNAIDESDSE